MIIKTIEFDIEGKKPATVSFLQANSFQYKEDIFSKEKKEITFEINAKQEQESGTYYNGVLFTVQKPCMIYVMENGKTVDTINCWVDTINSREQYSK